MQLIPNIPIDLLSQNRKEGDVSILIGENGSGKSQMLGELANRYIRNGKTVIAISNSVYDKFPDNGRNLHLLRDRAGRRKAKRSIKSALVNISPFELKRLKNASEALRFVGYDPVIGIENISFSVNLLDDVLSKDSLRDNRLSDLEIDEIKSLLYKLDSFKSESIIWLSLVDFSFSEIDRASIIQLLKWEGLLHKLGIIDSIKIFLRKNFKPIHLFDASSGELSYISTIIYLSTTINDNSAILIDEPENSLHPSWQKDYIKIINDLFYLYQPKIIVATHSALILTGAEVSNNDTVVYECANFQFNRKINEPINIEEAFLSYFNVVTPENRYLSSLLIKELNKLAENEITYEKLMRELDELQEDSFQGKQKEVIGAVRDIAQKIINPKLPNNG